MTGRYFVSIFSGIHSGRLFLEGMRNPNYVLYVIPNVLGISQLVAILFMIAAVSAFVVLQVKAKKDNEI